MVSPENAVRDESVETDESSEEVGIGLIERSSALESTPEPSPTLYAISDHGPPANSVAVIQLRQFDQT